MHKGSSTARPLSAALLVNKGAARPAQVFGTRGAIGQATGLFDAPPTPSEAPEAPGAPLVQPKPELAAKKAAFTFRMDERRHFRLRLLSAHQNRSAQKILEEALDAYLDGHAPQTGGLACPCFNDGE